MELLRNPLTVTVSWSDIRLLQQVKYHPSLTSGFPSQAESQQAMNLVGRVLCISASKPNATRGHTRLYLHTSSRNAYKKLSHLSSPCSKLRAFLSSRTHCTLNMFSVTSVNMRNFCISVLSVLATVPLWSRAKPLSLPWRKMKSKHTWRTVPKM